MINLLVSPLAKQDSVHSGT